MDTKKNIFGLINSLKIKKIKKNPEPLVENNSVETTTVNLDDDSFVDLHMEVARKVDALIKDQQKKCETKSPEEKIKTTFGRISNILNR